MSSDGGSSQVAKGSYMRQRGLSQINRGRRRLLPPIDGGRNPPCVRQDPPAHNGSGSGGDFFGTSEILERRQIQTAVTPKGNMGRGTKELSSTKPLTAPAAAPEPPRVASTRLRGEPNRKWGNRESGKRPRKFGRHYQESQKNHAGPQSETEDDDGAGCRALRWIGRSK